MKKIAPLEESSYTVRLKRELGIANIEFEEGASDKQLQKFLTKEENRREKADEPEIGATRYIVNVNGQDIQADYLPHWLGGDTIHIQFKTEGVNAISETGYRSHFIMGTPKDVGITEDNVQEKLQELADSFAKDEIPKRAQKRRWEIREKNKKDKEEVKENVKNQTTLF